MLVHDDINLSNTNELLYQLLYRDTEGNFVGNGEIYDKSPETEDWIKKLLLDCQDFNNNFCNTSDIKEVINNIKISVHGYIKTGVLLDIVRLKGLWNKTFDSFYTFCVSIFGKKRNWYQRQINASKVAINLINYGHDTLPLNESQARELTYLSYYEQDQVWSHLLNTVSGEITADTIRYAVKKFKDYQQTQPGYADIEVDGRTYQIEVDPADKPKPKPKRKAVQIFEDTLEVIKDKARRHGMQFKDYLDDLVQKDLLTYGEEDIEKEYKKISQIYSEIEQKARDLAQKEQQLLEKERQLEEKERQLEEKNLIKSETAITTDKQNLIESDPQVKTGAQLVETLPPLKTEKSLEEFFVLIAQVFVSWNLTGRLKT